jgi:LPXTG-motif cell wall-anchored protein
LKKIVSMLLAGFMLAATVLMLGASSASATGGGTIPSPDNNKKVTLCHATGSGTNPYVTITVSVNAFYNAGHIGGGQPGAHDGDIYPGFTWTDNKGVEHVVAPQGDQSLLAFENCQRPAEDEKVAKPDAVYNDECGTKDDVFSVAPGKGYTVGPVVVNGATQSITVTLLDGFTWTDDSTSPLVITRPAFTNEPCDLPETGKAEYAYGLGGLVLLALAFGGFMFYRAGRNNVTA